MATRAQSAGRRGGILSGLLLAALAAVLLMAVAGVGIYRSALVTSTHGNAVDGVSIDTPAGRIDIRAHDRVNPDALGIPLYPGATRSKDGAQAAFEWTSPDGKREKALALGGANFFTSDATELVVAYYRRELPDWMLVTDRDSETGNHSTRLEFHQGGLRKFVSIRREADGTHIGVASVGEPASN